MIITNRFVHIANPRCGSTFSRRVIRNAFRLSQRREIGDDITMNEILLPNTRGIVGASKDHHCTVSQIPDYASNHPILSSIRHPISLAKSTFKLGLWISRLAESKGGKISGIDTSPLGFLDYQESTMLQRWGISRETQGIGYFTGHFVTMFSRSPKFAFDEAKAGRFSLDLMDELIPDITFHRQENLAIDLYSSLLPWVGDEIAMAATGIEPTNVSSIGDIAEEEFSQCIGKAVVSREHYLLDFLDKRGIKYERTSSA